MPDKGTACHWSVNTPPADHAGCLALIDQIAAQHASQGSSGHTFYNWLYCNHGHRMQGRGWAKQSGANGTTAANRDYWAACWLGGPGHAPSTEAFAQLQSIVDEAPGAKAAFPHQRFYATACPGPDIVAWCASYSPAGVPAGPPDLAAILALLSEEQMLNGKKLDNGEYVVPFVGTDDKGYAAVRKPDGSWRLDGLGGRIYSNPSVETFGDTAVVLSQGDNQVPYQNVYKAGKWSGWSAFLGTGAKAKNAVGK